MQELRLWSVLLVSLCMVFITRSTANEIRYKLRISEKGSRFTENVIINVKENTVRFTVPKHNDVESSDVLNDFNQNLTITRLPDQGMCHVRPLDKSLPHPREMKSNMDYVRRTNALKRKQSMLVTSTQWTLRKQLKMKDLPRSVVKFCFGLPTYSLKEIKQDDWKVEQESASGRVRRSRKSQFAFCKTTYPPEVFQCQPEVWRLNCKIRTVRTCTYWVRCPSIKDLPNFDLSQCDVDHNWTQLVCCDPSCPPKGSG